MILCLTPEDSSSSLFESLSLDSSSDELSLELTELEEDYCLLLLSSLLLSLWLLKSSSDLKESDF